MGSGAALVWIGALAGAQIACDSGSVTRLERPDDTGALPVDTPQADTDAPMPQSLAEAGAGDAGGDAGEDAGLTPCERAVRTFEDFLSTHQSCEVDADCRVINDCGPSGDSFALNVAAVDEGYQLYDARCGFRGFDGFPTYVARCREGRCTVGERYSCCGCAPPDGGADAG